MVAVGATGDVGTAAVSATSGPVETLGKEKAPLLEEGQQTEASGTARALARLKTWYQIELRESNGLIVVVLLGAVIFCVVGFLFIGGGGKDSDKKDLGDPLRPQGIGSVSRPSPMNSQLPSQQGNLRTPLASSVSLQATKASDGPEVGGKTDGTIDLPPICPSLILPHTEARFMIQMDHLLRVATGPINILGTSGRKLLHALVCDSPDGRRCLMLASCGCEDDPRTCIFTPQTAEPSQALEIFGKAGKFYGWLEFPGGNQAVLSFSGDSGVQKPVLQIEMGNQQDLRMSASTMDGRLLASAGRNVGVGGRQFEGNDSWKMQVKPGVDAVLITSCMLSLTLLRPWPSDEGFSMAGGTATSLGPLIP